MTYFKNLINILAALEQAVYITDLNRKILFFNDAAEVLTGFIKSEVVNKHCHDNLLNHVDEFGNRFGFCLCPIKNSNNQNKVVSSNIFLQHKNGHRIPVSIKSIPYIEGGEVLGSIEVFTSRIRRVPFIDEERLLEHLSMIDPLTELYNRNFLKHKLQSILASNDPFKYAFLFLDIDDFKIINDTHGHLVGDKVLRVVSDTLLYNTTDNDFVIRFGGEEFLIILRTTNIEDAKEQAESLRIIVNNSYIDKIDYNPTVSIGVTLYNKKESIDYSINKADKAMYLAKRRGKNQIQTI